jgi:hypothetical protein
MNSTKLNKWWPLFLLLFFGQNVLGQNQAPTPDEILSRCARAMGAPHAGFDLVAEGETKEAGSDSAEPIRIRSHGIESFRFERGGSGAGNVAVVSRGRGWQRRQGQKTEAPYHTTAYFKADHLPGLTCGAFSAGQMPGIRATYLGEETTGSKTTFHVKLSATPKGKNPRRDAVESVLSEYHLWIDQQSFVVLKTATYLFSPNAIENRSLWETYYSDYRTVNGTLLPFHLDNFLSGQSFSTTTFSSIRIDDTPLSNQDLNEAR